MLFLVILVPLVLILGVNWLIGLLSALIVGLVVISIGSVAVLGTFLVLSDAKDDIQQ